MSGADVRIKKLEGLLNEGLNLCVRARELDETEQEFERRSMEDHRSRALTPILWMNEQYQTDLADWESRARTYLTPINRG